MAGLVDITTATAYLTLLVRAQPGVKRVPSAAMWSAPGPVAPPNSSSAADSAVRPTIPRIYRCSGCMLFIPPPPEWCLSLRPKHDRLSCHACLDGQKACARLWMVQRTPETSGLAEEKIADAQTRGCSNGDNDDAELEDDTDSLGDSFSDDSSSSEVEFLSFDHCPRDRLLCSYSNSRASPTRCGFVPAYLPHMPARVASNVPGDDEAPSAPESAVK